MNKKILLSAFVVLFVIAASLGATMAWFTAEADVPDNVFQAGTVTLEADDQFVYGSDGLRNWNPGDCTPKLISVEYTGSKRAFLRMQVKEEWSGTTDIDETGNRDGVWYDRDVDNITWYVYTGDIEHNDLFVYDAVNNKITWSTTHADWDEDDWKLFNYDNKWVYDGEDEGWWYYNGDDKSLTTNIDGTDIGAVNEDDPNEPIVIVSRVCLAGEETGNHYQNATYTISVKFQAIQATHEGESGWNWDDFGDYN